MNLFKLSNSVIKKEKKEFMVWFIVGIVILGCLCNSVVECGCLLVYRLCVFIIC